MKLTKDAEYKKIYMDRILSQLHNNSSIATHIKDSNKRKLPPKVKINDNNMTKQDREFKAKHMATIQGTIDLNMKKDKSADDVLMGIIPPIADNRTTEQKVADFLTQRSTAMKNSQLLFSDSKEAQNFIYWLIVDKDMMYFFNESFIDIKTKFTGTKILLANRVKIYLQKLYEREMRTGGLDDPLQRTDFFGATGLNVANDLMYPPPPPPPQHYDDADSETYRTDNSNQYSFAQSSGSYDPLMHDPNQYSYFPNGSVNGSDSASIGTSNTHQSRDALAQDLEHFTGDTSLGQEEINGLPSQGGIMTDAQHQQQMQNENEGLNSNIDIILNMFNDAYTSIRDYYKLDREQRKILKKSMFQNNDDFIIGAGKQLRVCSPEQVQRIMDAKNNYQKDIVTSEIVKGINGRIKYVANMYNIVSPHINDPSLPSADLADEVNAINEAIVTCNILRHLQEQIQHPYNVNPFVVNAESAQHADEALAGTYDPNDAELAGTYDPNDPEIAGTYPPPVEQTFNTSALDAINVFVGFKNLIFCWIAEKV